MIETKGIKLTFNPQKAFYFFVTLTLVFLFLYGGYCFIKVLTIKEQRVSKPIQVEIVKKSNNYFKVISENGYHYSIKPTKSWYETAKIGDKITTNKRFDDSREFLIYWMVGIVWAVIVSIAIIALVVSGIDWIVKSGDKEIEIDLTNIKINIARKYKGIS